MKKLLAVLAVVAVLSLSALAGTVQIQFNSTGPYNYQGEPSYQYMGTVNGASAVFMCINNNLLIGYGESWQAFAEPIVARLDQEAAWLFLHAGNGSNPDYQGGVWSLYNPNTFETPGVVALLSTVSGLTFTPGEFKNVVLYEATSDQEGWTYGQPQGFFGTPEPSSLVLLGSGVLGMAGLLRKRLAL